MSQVTGPRPNCHLQPSNSLTLSSPNYLLLPTPITNNEKTCTMSV